MRLRDRQDLGEVAGVWRQQGQFVLTTAVPAQQQLYAYPAWQNTSGDGIPDFWKTTFGLLPLTNGMYNGTPTTNVNFIGYSDLEEYLAWLAGPHALVQTNATVIDLWPYTLGFTNGATYTVFNGTNGTVTLTNSHYALFKPTAGFTGLAGFNFAVADGDGTSLTNTMGLLVSVIYIPKNLVWRGDGSANIWDTTNTADWFNGNELTTFNSSDNVTFDDTGSASPAAPGSTPA